MPVPRWGFRALGVLLGVVAALALAEGALRLLGVDGARGGARRMLLSPRGPELQYVCYDSNPRGAFSPRPDISSGGWSLHEFARPPRRVSLELLSRTPWCVEERSSSGGLRDREYAARPGNQVVRILGIGDSFARGEGVPLSRTLFKRMERRLGQRYELLNGGVAGAGLQAELTWLRQLARRFHSQRALVVFNINDIELTEELASRGRVADDMIAFHSQYQHSTRGPLARRLVLPRLVASWLASRRIQQRTVRWYLDSYTTLHNAPNIDGLRQSLQTLARLPGVRVALVLYPLMARHDGQYPFAAIHRKVQQMAQHAGLPVLDLAPVFAGRDPATLWVHPIDHHPNGEAHRLAAEAVVRWLRHEQPWFLRLD